MTRRDKTSHTVETAAAPNLFICPIGQPDGKDTCSPVDLTKLANVSRLVKQIRQAFAGRVAYAGLSLWRGFELTVGETTDGTDLVGYTLPRYWRDAMEVADKLRQSGCDPGVDRSAYDRSAEQIVAQLRTVTLLHQDGFEVRVVIDDEERVFPVVPLVQFSKPEERELSRQINLQVRGIDRDDDRGHAFRLGDGSVTVHLLPLDDPRWAWPQIHDVLDYPTWFVGGVHREAGSSIWIPDADTKLIRQERLFDGGES